MKKYLVKESGRVVKEGENILKMSTMETPIGNLIYPEAIQLTKEVAKELIEKGVLAEVGSGCNLDDKWLKLKTYHNRVMGKWAQKFKLTNDEANDFLGAIKEMSPSSYFQMILREIAIVLDEQYENHIHKSEEIYSISMTNGKIIKLNKENIRNYRNFAAFRTLDDVQIACRITRDLKRELFSNEQKSN